MPGRTEEMDGSSQQAHACHRPEAAPAQVGLRRPHPGAASPRGKGGVGAAVQPGGLACGGLPAGAGGGRVCPDEGAQS